MTTNYDKIKSMSMEQMAELLEFSGLSFKNMIGCKTCERFTPSICDKIDCPTTIEWLNLEAE